MVDTPLIAGELFDPYVDLAVCAMSTSRVRLGPAVSTFALRHPVATGAAMLSLDRLARGRIQLGLGIGGSALVTIGQLARPEGTFEVTSTRQRRDELRHGIDLLRRVFAGETATLGSRDIRLPHPVDIPIVIAASGPRALALAGAIADGVIIQVGIDPDMLREAIDAVHQGAERAGRDPSTVRLICSTFAVISDNRRADIDQVRPLAGYFYSVMPDRLERVGIVVDKRIPDWVPVPDLAHAYDWADAMAAAKTYITDDAVERLCLVGPAEDARHRLEQLAELGIDEFFLRWSSSFDMPDPLVETFGREIIPAFAR
jgi:5,10-methylenetetrahydromethanopterin reductase